MKSKVIFHSLVHSVTGLWTRLELVIYTAHKLKGLNQRQGNTGLKEQRKFLYKRNLYHSLRPKVFVGLAFAAFKESKDHCKDHESEGNEEEGEAISHFEMLLHRKKPFLNGGVIDSFLFLAGGSYCESRSQSRRQSGPRRWHTFSRKAPAIQQTTKEQKADGERRLAIEKSVQNGKGRQRFFRTWDNGEGKKGFRTTTTSL